MTTNQVREDIDRTSIQLILNESFYGHFFSNLIKQVVTDPEKCPTAAVSLNAKTNTLSLLVGEKFWINDLKCDTEEATKNAKYFVIKHEILHILFKHIFHYNKFSNKTIANIAVDFVVHQYIKLDKIPAKMRPNLAILENFADFFPNIQQGGSDLGQTSEYYYNILIKEGNEISKMLGQGEGEGQSGGGSGQGSGSGSGQGQQGDQQSDQNSDGSGEGEGNDEDGEGQGGGGLSDHPNWDKLNKSQKQLAKFMNGSGESRAHNTWKGISELGEGKKEFVENWVDKTLQETVKKCERSNNGKNGKWRGTLPAGLLEYIDQLIESLKPVTNWKKMFRQFASNGENSRVETTLKRKSKRYGTYPGHKIVTESKIMVAIDTSGSVDNESLAEFFSEIHHIWRTGSTVHIVECDTEIGKTWEYVGKPPEGITGRGGTDFNAPIIYANKEYKPDCVIYFTDGYAPKPVKCGCPLMWIICKNGGVELDQMKDFQGTSLKMNF